MGLAELAQQAPQPQAGGHFNGTINYQGQQIPVQNSVATFQGQQYIVSDDGKMVVDSQRRIVGVINNGNFQPATPEIIDQLKKQGAFESEPQATTPQAAQ